MHKALVLTLPVHSYLPEWQKNSLDSAGQHYAPSEPEILQQLEAAVVMPNYHRLIPNAWNMFGILDNGYCAAAAKQLPCWISIQRCDRDGDNRLRVWYLACKSYNAAVGAHLDCSDRTLFSSEESGDGLCTGDGGGGPLWQQNIRNFILLGLIVTTTCFFIGAVRQIWRSLFVDKGFVDLRGSYESLDSAKVQICVCDNRIYGAIGSSWASKFLHFASVMGQTWRQVGIMFIQNFKSSKISSL